MVFDLINAIFGRFQEKLNNLVWKLNQQLRSEPKLCDSFEQRHPSLFLFDISMQNSVIVLQNGMIWTRSAIWREIRTLINPDLSSGCPRIQDLSSGCPDLPRTWPVAVQEDNFFQKRSSFGFYQSVCLLVFCFNAIYAFWGTSLILDPYWAQGKTISGPNWFHMDPRGLFLC